MGEFFSPAILAIIHYFKQKKCNFCNENFDSESIKLLKQEAKVVVVQITCTCCKHSYGTAVVAMNPSPTPEKPEMPQGWTKKDIKRLANFKAINEDDVLTAYKFIKELGNDWVKYLPSPNKRKAI